MRKIWIFLILALVLSVSVSAAGTYIRDEGNLLTDRQIETISQQLQTLSSQYDMEIILVTADHFSGKSAENYADTCWKNGNYGKNGILFLFSMTQRQWYIYTAGRCMSIFGDQELSRLEGAVIPQLKAGDSYGAADVFVKTTEDILIDHAKEQASWAWKTPLICFGVGAVIALIVVLVMASQHKNVHKKAQAGDYVKPGSFQLTQCLDLYLYQTTTRRRKPQNSGGSGGGSGRSHGGRGGSF